MAKELFDYDPVSGLTQYFEYNADTDETTIETIQDASGLNAGLEMAKTLRNDDSYTRKGMKNDALHYAWIPDGVLLKWKSEGVDINDRKALFKKVNEPDYAYLKTTNLVHRG